VALSINLDWVCTNKKESQTLTPAPQPVACLAIPSREVFYGLNTFGRGVLTSKKG
jgi:hypothetical protein